MLEIRPSQYVISLTKESWELVKVLMCIKLYGSKFLHVDSILQGNKDSFVIVQAAERTETANKFTLSTLYSFRCAEQVVLTVVPSEQKDRTLEIKSNDVGRIKESIKGRQYHYFMILKGLVNIVCLIQSYFTRTNFGITQSKS